MPAMTTGTTCGCGEPATVLAWQGDTVPRIRLCDDCYPGNEEWFEGSGMKVRPALIIERMGLVDGCQTCDEERANGKAAPSHAGSPNCESGSIASGGKDAHCTCNTCF